MRPSPSLETAPSPRVAITFRALAEQRNWFKAAAALEGMSLEEWLYTLAAKRAQAMHVPRPFGRDPVSAV
jgi:uncharacterized protein (DUF1778 family)